MFKHVMQFLVSRSIHLPFAPMCSTLGYALVMDSEAGNASAPNQRSRPTFLKMLLLLHFIVFTLISSCVLIGYAIDYRLHTPLIIGLTQLLFAVPGYYGVHHADTGKP